MLTVLFFISFFLSGFDLLDKQGILEILPGFGAAQIVMIISCMFCVLTRKNQQSTHHINAFITFVIFVNISIIFNTMFLGSKAIGIFEGARFLYFILILYTLTNLLTKAEFENFLIIFSIGCLTSLYKNYSYANIYKEAIETAGFVQLSARNLSGVIITGLTLILFHISQVSNQVTKSWSCYSIILGLSYFIQFTFSKGAWYSFIFVFIYCVLAYFGKKQKNINANIYKYIGIVVLMSIFSFYIFSKNNELKALWKLKNTTHENNSGDTFKHQARIGNMLSSVLIALQRPIIGCGPENWFDYNEKNKSNLKSFYHPNDNPHSAIFYILSCYGIISFYLYLRFIVKIYDIVELKSMKRTNIKMIFLLIFVFHSNLLLQTVSSIYGYIYLSYAFKIKNHTLDK